MQMPPPPPPPPPSNSSSTSTDGGYLGIPAMSNRLKALEEKILRQFGPLESPTTPTANRTTSRNINTPIRQIPSTRKTKQFDRIFVFVSIASLIGSSASSRASSAPPTRKGVFHLPLSPLQPTPANTRLEKNKSQCSAKSFDFVF